jgi:hypothetical protein
MSNTAKVFITHEPLRAGENGLEWSFPLEPLLQFGEPVILYKFREVHTEGSYSRMKEKLEDFDESVDSIFPCGSPASMLLVGHALGELGIDSINMISYDRRSKQNIPLKVKLYD